MKISRHQFLKTSLLAGTALGFGIGCGDDEADGGNGTGGTGGSTGGSGGSTGGSGGSTGGSGGSAGSTGGSAGVGQAGSGGEAGDPGVAGAAGQGGGGSSSYSCTGNATGSGHMHQLFIMSSHLAATGPVMVSSSDDGHQHQDIELSEEQLQQLRDGMPVVVQTDDLHPHTWMINCMVE